MDLKQYLLDKKAYLKPILAEVRLRDIRLEPSRSIITAIIGPRRAGKTYLFYSFIKDRKLKDEDYLIINFEDTGISGLSDEEVLKCTLYHQELYGAQPKYLF
ncbi:MAG: AAA family ATPase, partial [Candidatus Micrarchaeia archaeon]